MRVIDFSGLEAAARDAAKAFDRMIYAMKYAPRHVDPRRQLIHNGRKPR
jgi:hypothetical protein